MCWNVKYIALLFVFTLINYIAARLISTSSRPLDKKLYLCISIVTSLGLLFVFKYYGFFTSLFRSNCFPELGVLLPVGISFYTFQTLSYTIDVYRGDIRVEKNLARFALYVSFFPQLVAGPIERAGHLLGQFSVRHYFSYSRVVNGILLILWGFFQKVVIADRLAVFVDAVFNNPSKYYGITIWVATVFFAFQIYCDFSGYTDIARGCARILGFELMQNFKSPYFATSLQNFWRRWHISLSTWLRDYLYIPLGGNRSSTIRWLVNILIVFLFCGLWHGASWNFVVWGALHGLLMVLAVITSPCRVKLAEILQLVHFPITHRFFKIVIVFSLVCFCWIFFRANSINDAFVLIRNSLIFNGDNNIVVQDGLSSLQMALSIILIFVLITINVVQEKIDVYTLLSNQPFIFRWLLYLLLVWTIIILGAYDNDLVQFIYFQF